MTGRVVLVNGGSSSGKTTLCRAAQERLPGTWLLAGIDVFLWMAPQRLFAPGGGGLVFHGDGTVESGPEFDVEQDRWRRAIASLVRDGAQVLVDEVLIGGAAEQARWEAALDGLDRRWVAVRCAPEVAAAREARRGDRVVGMARQQALQVHEGVRYDVDLDSTDVDRTALVDRFVQEVAASLGLDLDPAADGLPPRPSGASAWPSATRSPWEST